MARDLQTSQNSGLCAAVWCDSKFRQVNSMNHALIWAQLVQHVSGQALPKPGRAHLRANTHTIVCMRQRVPATQSSYQGVAQVTFPGEARFTGSVGIPILAFPFESGARQHQHRKNAVKSARIQPQLGRWMAGRVEDSSVGNHSNAILI